MSTLILIPSKVLSSYTVYNKLLTPIVMSCILFPSICLSRNSFIKESPQHMILICIESCVIYIHINRWEAGGRKEDGLWAPWWYKAVHRSTGFTPPSQYPKKVQLDDSLLHSFSSKTNINAWLVDHVQSFLIFCKCNAEDFKG
mgnify:CR=1 FL=1